MKSHIIRATAVAAALFSIQVQAGAGTVSEARAEFPRLQLAEHGASGQKALELLGSHLNTVAAAYRRSPEAFRQWLLNDPKLHIDRAGRVYVVDTIDHPLPASGESVEAGLRDADAKLGAPLSETFKLHSRPGAKRTIFLDFDGGVIENTAWNNGGGPLTAQPYDADGNLGSFSDDELGRIQGIWQRVAEDFAPFDIDVTTEQPSADRLTRDSDADDVYGTTALITNRTGVYSCGCGGVAYVGVYNAVGDWYKPALVFWDALGPSDEKFVAEATSHEVGHNLGLGHDGWSGGGYYGGHGDGPTGWAPIMGVGYGKPVAQWSKGEYDTANNTEDDFVVMEAHGGPLRADDHGNTTGTATKLKTSANGGSVELSGHGVIERREDVDVFSFKAGAGEAKIKIKPDSRAPNLDVYATVVNEKGKRIAKSSPSGKLGATLKFTVPSNGTYYVTIDGVGFADPRNTGYSDYGSLGQFKITGTVPAP